MKKARKPVKNTLRKTQPCKKRKAKTKNGPVKSFAQAGADKEQAKTNTCSGKTKTFC